MTTVKLDRTQFHHHVHVACGHISGMSVQLLTSVHVCTYGSNDVSRSKGLFTFKINLYNEYVKENKTLFYMFRTPVLQYTVIIGRYFSIFSTYRWPHQQQTIVDSHGGKETSKYGLCVHAT